MRSKRTAKKAKKFKPVRYICYLFYIVVLLTITTPLVLFFGPYENTRKAFIQTLLATRHAYWLTDNLSQDTINKLLGIDNSEIQTMSNDVEEEDFDIDKVDVKYNSSTEISRYNVHTEKYDAYILEIKNPLSIKAAMTKYLGKLGQKTSEMAEEHNAVAAINGGAFIDASSDGTEYGGTGAEPGGFVISEGKIIYPKANADQDKKENVIGFTSEGKLIVGDHSLKELHKLKVKEAMCFRKPNIIINGKRQIKNKMEEGFNPRTAIGQKSDGTVIFLVIDGRKINKVGATLYDVQEIMMGRGAVNAGALDGGYSSTMYYKGEVINSPNAWNGERSVATAFYVE